MHTEESYEGASLGLTQDEAIRQYREQKGLWRRARRFYLWPRWFWRINEVGVSAGGRLVRTTPYRVGFSWLWWEKGRTI